MYLGYVSYSQYQGCRAICGITMVFWRFNYHIMRIPTKELTCKIHVRWAYQNYWTELACQNLGLAGLAHGRAPSVPYKYPKVLHSSKRWKWRGAPYKTTIL